MRCGFLLCRRGGPAYDFHNMMAGNSPKPVIGLVGGVGAGKSTVARELEVLGCALVDGDKIGHMLLDEPEVRQALLDRWGQRVFAPDGRVDRKAVAAVVFGSPGELTALNAMMHPRIRRRMEELIVSALARADVPAVVMDAAVLLEAGWDDLCTHLVFVQAPDETRQHRVEQARGWGAQEWQSREKSQIPVDTKRADCYYALDNSSGVSHLREQIRSLFHQIVHSER